MIVLLKRVLMCGILFISSQAMSQNMSLYQLTPTGQKVLHAQHLGLVFGGGAALGAYQVGVWHVMYVLGMSQRVKAVSGSSVGSLNAVLFDTHNFQGAYDVWHTMYMARVIDLFYKQLLGKAQQPTWRAVPNDLQCNFSGISVGNTHLATTITQYLGDSYKHILASAPLYVTRVRVPEGGQAPQLQYVSQPANASLGGNNVQAFTGLYNVVDNLVASSAAYTLFPCKLISDGSGVHYYRDGGQDVQYANNIPYKILTQTGSDVVVVISLLANTDHLPTGKAYVNIQLDKEYDNKPSELLFNHLFADGLIDQGCHDAFKMFVKPGQSQLEEQMCHRPYSL